MHSENVPMASSYSDHFAYLKRLNARFAAWAASLSWWRIIGLFLVLAIAGSMISTRLNLEHETIKRPAKAKAKRISSSTDGKCNGRRITIGGPDGLVICVDDETRPATQQQPASAPAANASAAPGADAPASSVSATRTPVITISPHPDALDDEEHGSPRIVRTFGGYVGDLLRAGYIALLAYFIAAKIIVRKSEESEARVRSAVDSAEHEAMQRQLVQARLKLLQAQIEPHFLFNTLAAVDYLIETDTRRASIMQKTLIQYLRAALPQMRQESSSLGREMQLARSYLELLKMRIEDRLQVDINVPPGLESAVFPPMMLQTLVENAIKHGIEPKPEGGKVAIRARVQDGQLLVEVIDTGMGLPAGDIFAAPTTGTGLGLENIRDRLAMLYPNASRMELSSDAAIGTVVRIVIPYRVASNAASEAGQNGNAAAPGGSVA